jgi:uncharacterized membrane protein YphA (DoxX/SURF4 family)
MNVALWIVAGLLAAIFLMAGFMKMTQAKEKLAENMGWVEHYEPRQIKLIGLLETLGAIGLIVPALTGILPILTPLAAIGIALVMVGAMARHLNRGNETPMVAMNMAFLLMALFVAWGRFGDYAF